ncbi:MAG: DUF4199 domain-containing protein [Prevotellaceae bacterium]|nr:DUF4199 domain-containing protein [Candidatus Faecinaster equi]
MFRQSNAYAMQYGLYLGLYWIVGMVALANGLSSYLAGYLYLFILIGTPFLGCFLTKKFRNNVADDYKVTYFRGFSFSFLMYLYGFIILTMATYLYFEFIDRGQFIEANIALMQRPEIKEVFESPEIKSQIDEALAQSNVGSIEELLRMLTPKVLAANTLDVGIFLSLIMAFPTALVMIIKPKKSITE